MQHTDVVQSVQSFCTSSLAWGVAVGLIYSLPGIFNVFKTINQWAKQIQQLLAMGCQAGIALGQALGEKVGFSIGSSKEEAEKTVTGNLDSSDLATYVQSGVQGVADALGLKGGSSSGRVDLVLEEELRFLMTKKQKHFRKYLEIFLLIVLLRSVTPLACLASHS